jgi:uncharacterized glyoxalase superfamily protein PhnB
MGHPSRAATKGRLFCFHQFSDRLFRAGLTSGRPASRALMEHFDRTFLIATGHVVGRIASMLSNRSMPRSVVIPELAYPDIGYAIDWLCNTFGFTLRIRMGDHRAQLNFPNGGAVVLIEQSAEVSLRTSVMVRVEDVKAHYDRAKRSDVRIVREPTDYPYGERQYNVEDFAGHHWCFSQSIADVDPREWGGTPAEL